MLTGQKSPPLSAPREAQQGQLLFQSNAGHFTAPTGQGRTQTGRRRKRGGPCGWPLPRGGEFYLLTHPLLSSKQGQVVSGHWERDHHRRLNGTSRWFCPLGFTNKQHMSPVQQLHMNRRICHMKYLLMITTSVGRAEKTACLLVAA